MSDDVHFIDTTMRDGSQSLWAMGMRYGMMEPIAADLERAGFFAVEVIANGIFFKKIVRDLKEDPWLMLRMLGERMPRTLKTSMGALNLGGLGTAAPRVVQELALKMVADIVSPYRVQIVCNTADQLTRTLPSEVPLMRSYGFQVALALSYTISPRHSDELFAEQARQAAALRPDAIYLKDQGGLLTVDRIRALAPILLEAAGDIPVELHSHCTTGLAPAVYVEAMRLGIRYLHTGIPPASDGSAQPSVLDVARNARALGLNPLVDEELLEKVSHRLTSFARQEGLPLGQPTRYDESQFAHQIPGGVIANLRYQLEAIGLSDRLEEVKQEAIRIRAELGYPIMITPYSQHVVTQAAINVATGERYKVVIDDVIRFAQGRFGKGTGYEHMDENLRERLLSLPRAKELDAQAGPAFDDDMSLAQAKALYGDADMSDEEVVLRALMAGSAEVEAMRQAGPPRRYLDASLPLLSLLSELGKQRQIRYVHIERGGDSLRAERRSKDAVEPR
jgi:oxaloacetate decarboxylase alpha subunit